MIPFVSVINIVTQFLSNAVICHQSFKDVDIYFVFLGKGIQGCTSVLCK